MERNLQTGSSNINIQVVDREQKDCNISKIDEHAFHM